MSTIDDLRRTLDHHVAGLSDDTVERRAAVHRRVGVTRRRRRAGVAGAAAVLIATIGGILMIPEAADVPNPAPTVAGIPAPDELRSLGYRYEFTEGVDGDDGRATLTLDPAPEPRLVTWATSTEAQDVRVRVDSGAWLSYGVVDFGDWVLVPAGVSQRTTVQVGSGEPGLAVYSLTDDRPAGVTRDGVTFRDQVAGRPLLGAAIGAPGDADVVVDPSRFSSGLDLRYFCAGGPADAYLHVDTAAGGVMQGSGCDDAAPTDPGSSGDTVIRMRQGEDARLRLYLTHGPDGPLVQDPDVRVGLGVYATTPPSPDDVAEFPGMLEQGGHLYRLVERHVSETGAQGVEARAGDGRSPVLVMVGVNAGNVAVHADFGAEATTNENFTNTRGWSFTGLAEPGALVTARLESFGAGDPGTLGPGDSIELGFYERAD